MNERKTEILAILQEAAEIFEGNAKGVREYIDEIEKGGADAVERNARVAHYYYLNDFGDVVELGERLAELLRRGGEQ